MAKHQSPKPDSAKGVQKNHNSATKGNNTRKKGPLWSIRKALIKNKKSGESREIDVEVRVPWDAQYDPFRDMKRDLPEPFDALKLDWADEIVSYIAETNGKMEKETLADGMFEYRVNDEFGNLVFSVISARNAFIETRPRRKRRRSRKK